MRAGVGPYLHSCGQILLLGLIVQICSSCCLLLFYNSLPISYLKFIKNKIGKCFMKFAKIHGIELQLFFQNFLSLNKIPYFSKFLIV